MFGLSTFQQLLIAESMVAILLIFMYNMSKTSRQRIAELKLDLEGLQLIKNIEEHKQFMTPGWFRQMLIDRVGDTEKAKELAMWLAKYLGYVKSDVYPCNVSCIRYESYWKQVIESFDDGYDLKEFIKDGVR
jgi:hypothetical protein